MQPSSNLTSDLLRWCSFAAARLRFVTQVRSRDLAAVGLATRFSALRRLALDTGSDTCAEDGAAVAAYLRQVHPQPCAGDELPARYLHGAAPSALGVDSCWWHKRLRSDSCWWRMRLQAPQLLQLDISCDVRGPDIPGNNAHHAGSVILPGRLSRAIGASTSLTSL